MTDYDLIAPFYDIEHAHFDEDVSMYINFAELCTGPLLELACGSGRLLVPLASEGYTLTGVDTSEKMLSMAQQRLQDRKSTRLNSSHSQISYAVFCLKKKKKQPNQQRQRSIQ